MSAELTYINREMESQKYSNFDLFDKAMKEYNQTKSNKSESKEKICDHEYTIISLGWKICVICGLRLRRILSQETKFFYFDRCILNNKKKDHVVEIRGKMSELMGMIVRKSMYCEYTGESYYVEPPEAGLPSELFGYSEELYQACYDYKLPDGSLRKTVKRGSPIHCQTRSLCAAVLWKKVRSLYPMSLDEFTGRVGVSKLTITNTCKRMKQKEITEY